MDIDAVKAKIAQKAGVTGLHAYPNVPDAPEAPCAVVYGPEIDYDSTMGRGSDDYRFWLVLLVQRSDTEAGQSLINKYLAPKGEFSLKEAIENDVVVEQGSTLDGLVDIVRVASVRDYGVEDVNGLTYLTASVQVEVTA